MGKQTVVVAGVGKQGLGEDFLPASQKWTTGSATTLVKGNSGMSGGRGGIRNTEANCSSFKDVKRW